MLRNHQTHCPVKALIWFAQSQMTTSWRIGIDKKNKAKLVTHGLFSLSRNPIFLGVLMGNLGVILRYPKCFYACHSFIIHRKCKHPN